LGTAKAREGARNDGCWRGGDGENGRRDRKRFGISFTKS